MGSSFDERAQWFDAHYATARGRVRLTLVLERLDAMLPPPPARILDAGGGSGAVAIPLAERGHEVTLLDPSEPMLRLAREHAAASGVDVDMIRGGIGGPTTLAPGPFDAICCHAVLMYLDDVDRALAWLRSRAADGAVLSLLEKNRSGLAMRPGLAGDYTEALRALTDPTGAGRLGPNRARSLEEWTGLLGATGWRLVSCVGVRLFSDAAPHDLPPDRFDELLTLEREAGRLDPYRSMARLIHVSARAV